ncbi:putative lipase [Crotalus adamanteus]|uniref:Lipase n=1 Tax=Crotalus adamanteus TaxID=8729 RepID=A0AAW1BF77_CROAD
MLNPADNKFRGIFQKKTFESSRIHDNCGYNEKNLNVSQVDVYAGFFPDYSSVKNLNHWSQAKPPFYKIEDISVPIAVWSGGNDIAATKHDIESLLPRIIHLVFYKNIPDWAHFDPIWGLDAPQRFYPDVLELMQKYKD